ncbi:MAG TPA: glycosyl hydrolase [Nocardioides sp.]|uniref:glycosyl hydrolase n=1 Tax=Nocardioides sp. TaxID=35761 RepID=UPI002C46D0FC|nr:glycosyl hydrolase [Nocardioides sp.]HTW13506.1 glycosyl hydrolase [Nocardioides sp.]
MTRRTPLVRAPRRRSQALGSLLALSLAAGTVASLGSAPATANDPTAASAPSASGSGAALDLVGDPSALADVPDQFRPKFRWWWPTDALSTAEIDAELTAIKEAGFSGVEQTTLRNVDRWGTPAFMASMTHALTKARELGLTFDITLGPGWPVSAPAIDEDLSSQDLGYGTVDVAAGATYDGVVPDNPGTNASAVRRLVAVTAARVVSAPGVTPLVLDPDSTVNLTPRVRDGAVEWTAPDEGSWRIFGFWMRPTLQVNKLGGGGGASGAAGGSGGLVVDHLNREAVRTALASFDSRALDELAPLLRATGGDIFEDSLELAHGPVPAGQSAVFWTSGMLRNWTTIQDYSVTRYLPGLFDEIAFTGGADARVKADYDDTVNSLLVTDHLAPIEAWVSDKGMTFRAQTYQGDGHLPTDAGRLSAQVPKPDVESLGFGDPNTTAYQPGTTAGPRPPGTGDSRAVIDRYRQVVSGAHRSGADEVSNEIGASLFGAYRQNAIDIKQLADHSLAAGVSRMILHGFAYKDYNDTTASSNPWVGWCPWCASFLGFADSWNQDFPQFKALARWSDYTGRAGAVVRTGRPQVDLVVLDSEADMNGTSKPDPVGTPVDDFRKSLSDAGFNWDSISAHDLRAAGEVEAGRLLPDGPAYKALVVHDEPSLPAATAERIVGLAEAGLPVVVQGSAPDAGESMKAPAREDARVRDAIARLRTLPGVAFVDDPAIVAATVQGLEVTADITGPVVKDVVPVHRRTASGDAWFLYNNSTAPVDGTITFTTPGAPTEIDLWTGEVTRLGRYAVGKSASGATTVTVPVRIEAEDTAAFVFDTRNGGARALAVTATDADQVVRAGAGLLARDGQPGARTFTMSDGTVRTATLPALPDAVTIDAGWSLHATTTLPAGTTETDIELDTLADWKDLPALRGRSGTGVYTATVDLPASFTGPDRGTVLRLGEFAGAVRAWINDRPVPVSQVPGTNEVDVTDHLRSGVNTVRIELSTTLNNAMRATAQAGTPGYGNFASRPELPAGLLGPVQLVPYGQVEVKAPAAPNPPAPTVKRATTTTLKVTPNRVRTGKRATAKVLVTTAGKARAAGRIRVVVDGKARSTAVLKNGRAAVRLPKLKAGRHKVRVTYLGSSTTARSSSKTVRLVVVRKR